MLNGWIVWAVVFSSFCVCIFQCCLKMFPRSKYSACLCKYQTDVASLLEREVVPFFTSEAKALLRGKVILVTGAAGSIGSELCQQLLNYEPKLLIALDTNETGLFDLAESLRTQQHADRLYPCIGSITDSVRMERLFAAQRPEVIFHAAAYKHVPLLEQYPDQAIQTNVLAMYRLCHLAQKYAAKHFVFISSDKAAEPVSILGASKRIGEMVIQARAQEQNGITRFSAVRFGNVIGSRGSVVPVFSQQIMQGGPVTVTDPAATRYFMTIPEACGLVIVTPTIAEQGGLYILNMGMPVRIIDLATKMIHAHKARMRRDTPIVYTGLRPGERLHEPLIAANEELLPTAYDKIFCVAQERHLPDLAMLSHWLDALHEGMAYEDDVRLRERLFEIVQVRELLVTS